MNKLAENLKLVSERQHLVDVLMDKNRYAQKVLTNGQVVNVISGEIYKADVAIEGNIF